MTFKENKTLTILAILLPAILLISASNTLQSYPKLDVKYFFIYKSQIILGILGALLGILSYGSLYLDVIFKIRKKHLATKIVGVISTLLVAFSFYIMLSSLGLEYSLISTSFPNRIGEATEIIEICKVDTYNRNAPLSEDVKFLPINTLEPITISRDLIIKTNPLPTNLSPYIERRIKVVKPPKEGTLKGDLFKYYYSDNFSNESILKELDTVEVILYTPKGYMEGFIFR